MATIGRVECDGCGARDAAEFRNGNGAANGAGGWHTGSLALAVIRRRLTADGWLSRGKRGLDFCPACVSSGKAQARLRTANERMKRGGEGYTSAGEGG